ncbi:Mu transposase C-terminal domain-containing protein [Burkholderia ubonensis]|uniref:Mu transposase C-terminal domain-containing protein n=1 Tax=Burkholderia ubonensis TaxID=101571 RepID=UPI000F5758DA|nr:Mu transposase C-terminal domain-containing protein [Burkholderia ubonensis]RQP34992.1 hypothetical protein DF155_14175 [Burkholderia ubonensis]RQP37312.1 hypothetical protein DF154_19520 [Burkholderia ubonensis]RQP40920.1 hypothetical protein DF156_15485 [Burkholderia ubonensis]RQP52737.1 hypothetical protein DF159_29405 [Burkholderia ubonensis]RQP54316.1 hypothetical protein DF144_15380 [Burkholderia ubonensis]
MSEQNNSIVLATRLVLRELKTDRLYRVVTPEGAGYYTMLCDIRDAGSWPFAQPTETVLERMRPEAPDDVKLVIELDDPWSLVCSSRPDYDKNRLDADWQLILPLISGHSAYRVMHAAYRNKILNEHAALHKTSRQKLSRLLKRYWKRGLTREALKDDTDRCGGKGKPKTFKDAKNGRKPKSGWPGVPLWETTKKWLNIAADWYLEDPKKRTLEGALDRIAKFFVGKRDFKDQQGNAATVSIDRKVQPTVRQLQYLIYKERPYAVRKRAKLGSKGFELKGRAFHGRADQHVSGPGDAFVIDATIADVYLVSQFDRTLIVGRPTIYFAVDVFSRLIVGVYVGFEHPSWMAAMMLLVNVVTPKVAFCAQYGVEITEDKWPSHFLSSRILGDKGEMMAVQAGPLIVENLATKIENAPSGRPDFKSYVERRFGIVPSKFKAVVPGYVEKDFNERGARDYRLDAALDINEFTELIIWSVLQCNAAPITDFPTPPDMVAAEKAPTPIALWQHGVSTRSGTLRSFSIDEVRRSVLPRATATVTHRGISFYGVFYECPTAVRQDWFVKARDASWRVTVAFDPRDLGIIWLCEGGSFEECTTRGTNSKEFDFSGKTLAEHLDLKARDGENIAEALNEHMNLRVMANEAMDKIIAKAKAATKRAMTEAGISKLQTSDIRNANGAERAAQRAGEAGSNSDLSVGPRCRNPTGPTATTTSQDATEDGFRESNEIRSDFDTVDSETQVGAIYGPKEKILATLKKLRGI